MLTGTSPRQPRTWGSVESIRGDATPSTAPPHSPRAPHRSGELVTHSRQPMQSGLTAGTGLATSMPTGHGLTQGLHPVQAVDRRTAGRHPVAEHAQHPTERTQVPTPGPFRDREPQHHREDRQPTHIAAGSGSNSQCSPKNWTYGSKSANHRLQRRRARHEHNRQDDRASVPQPPGPRQRARNHRQVQPAATEVSASCAPPRTGRPTRRRHSPPPAPTAETPSPTARLDACWILMKPVVIQVQKVSPEGVYSASTDGVPAAL